MCSSNAGNVTQTEQAQEVTPSNTYVTPGAKPRILYVTPTFNSLALRVCIFKCLHFFLTIIFTSHGKANVHNKAALPGSAVYA